MRGFRSATWRRSVVVVALVVSGLAITRPHVTERWAVYLGDEAAPATAHLFLDPFPDLGSCEATVKVFAANGERAFCSGHGEFELGTAADAVLAADFGSLVPKAWFCLPKGQFIHKKA